MKEEGCRLCYPEVRLIDWKEQGFYGWSCGDCAQGRAFICKEDHGDITPDQLKVIDELTKKHYPGLKSSGQAAERKSHYHWYDFLNNGS